MGDRAEDLKRVWDKRLTMFLRTQPAAKSSEEMVGLATAFLELGAASIAAARGPIDKQEVQLATKAAAEAIAGVFARPR